MQLAKEVDASILGIVGRDGGYTAKVGDAVLVLPSLGDVTAQVEGFQAVVWHMLVSHPRDEPDEVGISRGSDPSLRHVRLGLTDNPKHAPADTHSLRESASGSDDQDLRFLPGLFNSVDLPKLYLDGAPAGFDGKGANDRL